MPLLRLMKTFILALLLITATFLQAQDTPQHRFLDWKNAVPIATSAAAISMDMLTTQRFLAYPDLYEGNPISRLYGQSRTGSIAIGFTALTAEVGGMYLSHRLEAHHGRVWGIVERSIPLLVTGIEFRYAHANQQLVNSHHPR